VKCWQRITSQVSCLAVHMANLVALLLLGAALLQVAAAELLRL
jgi:hypothetical protein